MGRGQSAAGPVAHLIVFDNEAIQALRNPGHAQHRRALSLAQVVADRRRRVIAIQMAVPTAVRAEASWDRTSPRWAFLNHLRIADYPLDAASTNATAAIRERTGVSVADAQIGALVRSTHADQITVVTSDPGDIRLVAGDRQVTIVAI